MNLGGTCDQTTPLLSITLEVISKDIIENTYHDFYMPHTSQGLTCVDSLNPVAQALLLKVTCIM